MSVSGSARAHADTVPVSTRGNTHIVDISDAVRAVVQASRVETGQCVAMVVGSTASLTTLEFEPGLVTRDMEQAFEIVAPADGRYLHEQTWHDDNGHSHVRAAWVGPSLALPVVDGELPLGTWQQIVLIDFDTRPRDRRVVVTVTGVG